MLNWKEFTLREILLVLVKNTFHFKITPLLAHYQQIYYTNILVMETNMTRWIQRVTILSWFWNASSVWGYFGGEGKTILQTFRNVPESWTWPLGDYVVLPFGTNSSTYCNLAKRDVDIFPPEHFPPEHFSGATSTRQGTQSVYLSNNSEHFKMYPGYYLHKIM